MIYLLTVVLILAALVGWVLIYYTIVQPARHRRWAKKNRQSETKENPDAIYDAEYWNLSEYIGSAKTHWRLSLAKTAVLDFKRKYRAHKNPASLNYDIVELLRQIALQEQLIESCLL